MKLFSAAQIKAWDQYTILNEPVTSTELMERAAKGCAEWISTKVPPSNTIMVFCGPGNNGGDGLAISRLLIVAGYAVRIYILGNTVKNSADFLLNLEKLQAVTSQIELLEQEAAFPQITKTDFVIDALFGYGINRKLEGLPASLVTHINQSQAAVISIDIPSGLFPDKSSQGNTVIRAAVTLTFQAMKLAFMLPENAVFTGSIHIIAIGLHPRFYETTSVNFEMLHEIAIRSFLPSRKKFSHKGTYGSALLIAGSHGMMGAAVLGARACLRSGAGKLTCYIPACGYAILQTSVPEAMCITDSNEKHITSLQADDAYTAYAIGPGIGKWEDGKHVMKSLFQKKPQRLIIDADGLNLLSAAPELLSQMPKHTILTPHPKEFEKLFGPSENDFDRLQLALEKSRLYQCFIVLKGKYSFIATPNGKGYFNPTGNPGMATAGSGDVLTGILLGLFAQSDNAEQVTLAGVYLHGLAGDIAAQKNTETALIAGDIVVHLADAFEQLETRDYFY